MRSITIMYDSLNRHMLSSYGSCESITPNFQRLAEHCVTYDRFYCGSMPCIPARRELHTGRYNFLHRSWGPMEPYDQSVFQQLSENGIYTHFVSDHAHYWQEGGLNYHTRFSSCEFIRGQEGDMWQGETLGYTGPLDLKRQDAVNRSHMQNEEDFPHVRAFRAGMDFLEKNWKNDNWHLHLEYFDPHEPFYVPEKYKKMYDERISALDWPPYALAEDDEETKQFRANYLALLTMCDTYLGYVLDFMDEHDMWNDTMLMINTDHGFLLGEHGYYAKNYMPTYDELCHLPFFLWDPVSGKKGERNQQLVQTIDLAPTLLEFHHQQIPKEMQGESLLSNVRKNVPLLRKYALFGSFGKHVNITDGRYVYMRAGRKEILNNYTLMPTHIFTPFSVEELRDIDREMTDQFSFTNGIPLMKIPASSATSPNNSCYWYDQHMQYGDLLYDLETDPCQTKVVHDEAVEARMKQALISMLDASEAPAEQYVRLNLKGEN